MIPPPTPAIMAIWSALIEERTGLHYPLREHALLAEKLSACAQEAGFESLLDYYYYLRYDPGAEAELAALADALLVNETYFFRELDALRVMVDRVIAPLVASGRRARVWSAACSTGEEPLTIAMLLAHAGLLPRVELVASDLSTAVLQRARTGTWGRRSVRDAPPPFAKRWLRELPGGWTVDESLRAAIDWRRVNLVDPAEVAAVGRFDVVVCRNVLIYFSDETATRVVGALTRALQPGGALFVGVSESLMRLGTSLACEERERVFFYRKSA